MSTSSTLNHLKGGDQLLRTQLDLETSLKNMVKEVSAGLPYNLIYSNL